MKLELLFDTLDSVSLTTLLKIGRDIFIRFGIGLNVNYIFINSDFSTQITYQIFIDVFYASSID